jgi:polyether ionophore transport system permease protein
MTVAGLKTMTWIQWTIRRKGIIIWVLALAGALAATAAAIVPLYNTPEKIHSYAAAVSGGSLYAINGKIEGIDSLGGIIQDEFAFIAAFLLPLLGISLVARSTRREEEAGRLEVLLSGRIDRQAPMVAALLIGGIVIVTTAVALAVVMAASGVPLSSSILYAASLGGLALVFAGIAAVIAQLTLHSRGAYFGGFGVLLVSYVLRGVGDATSGWVTWLSPLGWQEKTAPTGDQKWWVLLIPLVVGGALAVLAVRLAGRRDLGSALIRPGSGSPRASHSLRRPVGFALWLHKQSMFGWLAGGVVLGVMMGALAQQVIDAMQGNPAMAEALGAGSGHVVDGFIAVVEVYLAIIAIGYVVQAIGILGNEEAAGRVETRLAGNVSRARWLAAHATVVVSGLVVVVAVSSAAFGVASAISMGESGQVTRLLWSGIEYLPAELIFAGLALLLYGILPRFYAVAWGLYAAVTFIAFVGPGLNLSHWALDLAPTTHVGNPPLGTAPAGSLAVMAAVACALMAMGFVGFRNRNIPNV